ncbi:MAG: tRNA (guanosine(37)-N1)-methyltransferase TrmD [bacterium]
MKFTILTIFPDILNSYFSESIIKRAKEKGIININTIDLRNFAENKHKTTDDKPYGGGAGMIMKIEPIYKALAKTKDAEFLLLRKKNARATGAQPRNGKTKSLKKRIILLTPAGEKFNQKTAKKFSKYDELIFICGRYEGIDARVEKFVDEKISIGDFVLTGGELGAMVIIDSVTRLLPGALGNKESLKDESHSTEGILEYPQYTRPEIFKTTDGKKLRVPKILFSGNHKKIAEWREKKRKFGKIMPRNLEIYD